jgi:hypothetical protein
MRRVPTYDVFKLRKSENELADGSIKFLRLNDLEGLCHAADFDRALRQPRYSYFRHG